MVNINTSGGELPLYVTGDIHSKTAILVAYDIFGLHTGAREFCDKLSKSGHLVIMPDYFRGNPWPLDADPMDPDNKFMEWLPDFNNVHKDTEDVIKYMKATYGPEKMALLGFCWGGKTTFMAAKSNASDFCVMATCHASLLDESTDGKGIETPLLMLDAGHDPDRTTLLEPVKALGVKYEVRRYEDMEHGWTIRGDKNDSNVKKNMDDAYDRVEAHLNKYLLNVTP